MVTGGFGDETLNNVGNVTGWGSISNLTLVNSGGITANVDGSTLTITTNRGGFTNNGGVSTTGLNASIVINAAGHGPAANNGTMIISIGSSIAVNGNFGQSNNGSLVVGIDFDSIGDSFGVSRKFINSGDVSINGSNAALEPAQLSTPEA